MKKLKVAGVSLVVAGALVFTGHASGAINISGLITNLYGKIADSEMVVVAEQTSSKNEQIKVDVGTFLNDEIETGRLELAAHTEEELNRIRQGLDGFANNLRNQISTSTRENVDQKKNEITTEGNEQLEQAKQEILSEVEGMLNQTR